MKKQSKIILLITAAAFLAALLCSAWVLRQSPRSLVEIVQDGTVIQTVDLSTAEDMTIRIDSPDKNSYNIIEISDGKICVSEAACPDQTCVHMGVLKSDNLPIVCLPNKLIIRFAE